MQLQRPLILDGGMSRELIRLGAPFKQPEWSALALMEAPDFVRQAHAGFAAAGADVTTTNSYALVPFHIGQERFEQRGEELAALAGKLVREVADDLERKLLVAGSLPPIFGSYEPEKFDPCRVQEHLSLLVRGLTPYVDVWLGETLSLIAEAEAVKAAIQDTEKPLWISFTLADDDSTDLTLPRLRSGESVSDATCWALDAGVEALLFNCSRPEVMDGAIRVAKALFDKQPHPHVRKLPSIGVYANAFTPKAEGQAANVDISETRADMTVETYGTFAKQWIASGASIIGGCCGIGRENIQHLANTLAK